METCKGCKQTVYKLENEYCNVCLWDNMPKYDEENPSQRKK